MFDSVTDFQNIVKIRVLRICLSDWRQWTKLRLRSSLSVNRSLGTESCRAILFWAMKFCPLPPIHFNWWTLYPKFRVYGTAAILSRTAKFIAYLRFARWQRAVVRARSCSSQATVMQQEHRFACVCKHFASWFQAHSSDLKGRKSTRAFYWKIFRSRVLAQNRLRSLSSLVNARLISSALDYFALAVFRRENVALDNIPSSAASRVARTFLMPDQGCALDTAIQKFILRRLMREIMRSWLILMITIKKRRVADKRSFMSSWQFFVRSAHQYREEAARRHEQLQRLCSISQRVDKRLKCTVLRQLHLLCRERQNLLLAASRVSSHFQVLHRVKMLHAISCRRHSFFRAEAKLRHKVQIDFLRPIWRLWKNVLLERYHRTLWDRRELDATFQTWLSNSDDLKQRKKTLELLQHRVLVSKCRFSFASWQGMIVITKSKRSASDSFFKNCLAIVLRQSFMLWRVSVFRLKWDFSLVSSCYRAWKGAVTHKHDTALALKSLLNRNVNKTLCDVLKTWRARVSLQSRRRLMRRKVESKRSIMTVSYVFSHWYSLMEQAASKMKQKCQDALMFRADVLLRAFYLRWCHLGTHYMDLARKSLTSMARHCVSRLFLLWCANAERGMMRRLQKVACAALASRNLVISTFRLWRLFAFSHSQVKRHIASSDVASALAQSGRVLLSNLTECQRSRVMLLPRVLQVAFVWLSQRNSKYMRQSITSTLSCSVDAGSSADARSVDSSSSDDEAKSPLSMSQLFASAGPAVRRHELSLEWHRPNFGAQTSMKLAEVSSRNVLAQASQAPQARAAQLQQMLDELYGKSESP